MEAGSRFEVTKYEISAAKIAGLVNREKSLIPLTEMVSRYE
jgi:hypothetical protein